MIIDLQMKNANLIERESVYLFSQNYSIISLKLTSGTDSGDPNSGKIFDTGIISSGLNPFVTIGSAIFISYTPNQDLTAKVQGDCKEYSLGQWMSISRHEIPESVEVNKPRLLAA
jgi:hypothetical protein